MSLKDWLSTYTPSKVASRGLDPLMTGSPKYHYVRGLNFLRVVEHFLMLDAICNFGALYTYMRVLIHVFDSVYWVTI